MTGSVVVDFDAIVREAGIPADVPVSLAACRGGQVAQFTSGAWPDGRPVAPDDMFYAGSLAKQLTGAAIALLVREGRIDVDTQLRQILGELPAWADRVTLRYLLHHAGGLPAAGVLESKLRHRNWTNGYVMAALQTPEPRFAASGISFSYSNAGYVCCLGRVIERITGMSFGSFVEARLIAPLAIEGMHVLMEGEIPAHPQVAMMEPALPLSTVDGGLWTTASAFVAWLDRQNRDALETAYLVEQPGKLAD
ncbi:MAG: serine hydrolase domain-containing protein, partial [Devosia sp.]